MYSVVQSQGGEGYIVVDADGNQVGQEFRGALEAEKYMNSLMKAGLDDVDDDGGEGPEVPTGEFDWEGKFNLDLKDLMNQYGVASDMQKYFEGMEYDPQSESFLRDMFDVQQGQTDLKRRGIERQQSGLMDSLNQSISSALNQGEAASFQMNQASVQRGQQIGGMRGGSFANRFQSQQTQQGIYGQQNQLFSQTDQKIGTMDDALASLDLEAQQSQISFEKDIYGERQQFMDDFFARLMEVEQMEES